MSIQPIHQIVWHRKDRDQVPDIILSNASENKFIVCLTQVYWLNYETSSDMVDFQ